MATATTTVLEKPNIGVYTNPNHDLWIAESTPTLEDVKSGNGLKPGEVTIEVRSTGICGYALLIPCVRPISACRTQQLTDDFRNTKI
jgi:hypothetical protein